VTSNSAFKDFRSKFCAHFSSPVLAKFPVYIINFALFRPMVTLDEDYNYEAPNSVMFSNFLLVPLYTL
jgi:hypothetical protein